MARKFLLMGVVNITPDSFSDGGLNFYPEQAEATTKYHLQQDADFVDLGAESTRPGSQEVSTAEEWARLEPVIKKLLTWLPSHKISIDSRKPDIIRRVAELGVGMINFVSQNIDDQDIDQDTLNFLTHKKDLHFMATHLHGVPQTMQSLNPLDASDVLQKVQNFFKTWKNRWQQAGGDEKNLWLDPGIGFGKTWEANMVLLGNIGSLCHLHSNVAIGVSRKSFLGKWFGIENPQERDGVSRALEFGLIAAGVRLIRAHDLAPLQRVRMAIERT